MLDGEYFNPARTLIGPGKLTGIVKYVPENACILITYGVNNAMKYARWIKFDGYYFIIPASNSTVLNLTHNMRR
ncbi:hypothetical protein EFS38_02895 [Dickeya undicola]|uniref:Uncharacterized protein n=1 Tax=Dickeya undicola TaxID=1577887 RepID=A0ABX9WZ42_9GAMM|nr:hypothetical protein EFS38_02895 [Dickeya undicola]